MITDVRNLAFEKPAGESANARNHVRFWLVLEQGAEGRPVWLGAATFDRGVGVSHLTGQVTHHIAPNIDAARGLLTTDLETAGMVEATYQVSGIGPTFNGRNGEGDTYYTDGEIWMSRLVAAAEKNTAPPIVLRPPRLVRLKEPSGATRQDVAGGAPGVMRPSAQLRWSERKTLPKADTARKNLVTRAAWMP